MSSKHQLFASSHNNRARHYCLADVSVILSSPLFVDSVRPCRYCCLKRQFSIIAHIIVVSNKLLNERNNFWYMVGMSPMTLSSL